MDKQNVFKKDNYDLEEETKENMGSKILNALFPKKK